MCVLSLGLNDALISPVTHTLLTHKHTLIKTYTGTPHVLDRQTDRQTGGLPGSVRQHEREAICYSVSGQADSYFGSGLVGGGRGFLRYRPSRPAASKVQMNDQQNSVSPSIPCGPTRGRVIIKLRNNEKRG